MRAKEHTGTGKYVGPDGTLYLRSGQPEQSYLTAQRNLDGLKHLSGKSKANTELMVSWTDALISLAAFVCLMAGMAALLFFLTIIVK